MSTRHKLKATTRTFFTRQRTKKSKSENARNEEVANECFNDEIELAPSTSKEHSRLADGNSDVFPKNYTSDHQQLTKKLLRGKVLATSYQHLIQFKHDQEVTADSNKTKNDESEVINYIIDQQTNTEDNIDEIIDVENG
jgi:hypothetical protein